MGIFKKKTSITFYRDTETIPLYNWVKYFETNDLKYFNKEEKQSEENIKCMLSVYDDYIKISDNHSFNIRFSKTHKILRLKTKYNCVTMLCNALMSFNKNMDIKIFLELIEQLKKWHYRIDDKKDIFSQIEKIQERVQGIKTEVELLELDLKNKGKEESITIEKQLIQVSRGLELGYRLDSKEITLKAWVEMQKILEKEIAEKNKLNKVKKT